LKAHPNSTVCKLDGALPDGRPIVAKLAPREQIEAEERVYTEVLAGLSVETPEFFGTASGEHGSWIFLSYVDGLAYDSSRADHRQAAGRYAGRLHAESSARHDGTGLPDRGARFIREQLDGALATVRGGQSNPAASEQDRVDLRDFEAWLDRLTGGWNRLNELIDSTPKAVVHCDFVSKNCRIRTAGSGLDLIVLDWEMAGWGPITMDLGWVDLGAYREMVDRSRWGLSEASVQELCNCARLIRVLTATHWEIAEIGSSQIGRSMDRVRAYLPQLKESVRSASWID
jgi:aminoglycoside phosphotransferase (APT) family kinase protein